VCVHDISYCMYVNLYGVRPQSSSSQPILIYKLESTLGFENFNVWYVMIHILKVSKVNQGKCKFGASGTYVHYLV
jgi:hypothetical protein